eukprot:11793956-Ditylum_brightwellii.AAC.1
MSVRLEEVDLQKPLKKRIDCAINEHDDSDDKKTKSCHKTRHRQNKRYGRRILHQQSKHHGGKQKK